MKKIMKILCFIAVLLFINTLKGQYVFYKGKNVFGASVLENDIESFVSCSYELKSKADKNSRNYVLSIKYNNQKNIPLLILLPSNKKVISEFKYADFLPIPEGRSLNKLEFFNYLCLGTERQIEGVKIDYFLPVSTSEQFIKITPYSSACLEIQITKKDAKLLSCGKRQLLANFVVLPLQKNVVVPVVSKNSEIIADKNCVFFGKEVRRLYNSVEATTPNCLLSGLNVPSSPFVLDLYVKPEK